MGERNEDVRKSSGSSILHMQGLRNKAGICSFSLWVQYGLTLPAAYLGLRLSSVFFVCGFFSVSGCIPLRLRG